MLRNLAVRKTFTNFAGVKEKQTNTKIMIVTDLSREQIAELKENYLMQLADEGSFAEVIGRDYDEPSYDDLANADEIVPDCVIFKNYEGVNFVEDDFFCTCSEIVNKQP